MTCLIQDQLQVFPTREKIGQQLGPECVVWVTNGGLTMDTLPAYFQIDVAKSDIYALPGAHLLPQDHHGDRLSSDCWLKDSLRRWKKGLEKSYMKRRHIYIYRRTLRLLERIGLRANSLKNVLQENNL